MEQESTLNIVATSEFNTLVAERPSKTNRSEAYESEARLEEAFDTPAILAMSSIVTLMYAILPYRGPALRCHLVLFCLLSELYLSNKVSSVCKHSRNL